MISRMRPAGLALALLLAPAALLHAQPENTGADAVESFKPGTGAGLGADHFPGNVLGLPDPAARRNVPTIDGARILALGLGGEIILRFDRAPIVNIPGPDFTVFENAFTYTIGGKERIYAEPGEVSVSRDGVNFVPFPYDSITLRGCAGVGPTRGENDPGDPLVSGGNSFDLHDLGIDSVRWVRIRDVTSIIKDHPDHPFWDATLNGFDLDAVVRVTRSRPNGGDMGAGAEERLIMTMAPNPVTGRALLRVDMPTAGRLRARAIDPLGRDVLVIADAAIEPGPHAIPFDAASLPAGIYFIAVELDGRPAAMLRTQVIR